MFPLKQRDELVFGFSANNISTPSQNIFLNDDLNINVDHHANFQVGSTTTISFGGTTTDKPRTGTPRGKDIEMRKVVHRNIERQRRQQMSQLYASLRSLLPLEHIKGKRSISDLMNVSQDYINQLKNNVQELRVRRDKIKKPSSISSSTEITRSNGSGNLRNYAEVNKEQDGIEILIRSNGPEFRMSRVMTELMSSELNVVTCVSTKMSGRFVHKIHAGAVDLRLVDLSRLQERLTGVSWLANHRQRVMPRTVRRTL